MAQLFLTSDPSPARPGDACMLIPVTEARDARSAWVARLTSVPTSSAIPLGFLTVDIGSTYTTRSEPQTAEDGAALAADMPPSAQKILEAGIASLDFTPDVAGQYGFEIWEYAVTERFPRFVGDETATRYDYLGNLTQYLDVAEDSFFRIIDQNGRGASLQLELESYLVKAAELVNPTDEGARIATLAASVQAAVDDLVGVDIELLGEDIIAYAAELRTRWNEHIADAAIHTAADTDNEITYGEPKTIDGAMLVLSEWRERFLGHISRRGLSGVHTNDDLEAILRAGPAGDLSSHMILLADADRTFPDHQGHGSDHEPPVHTVTSVDPANRAHGVRTAVLAAVLYDAGTDAYSDDTTDANDSGTNDVALLPPGPWEVGDAFYFGSYFPFTELEVELGVDADDDAGIKWEFWDGATWQAAPGLQDDADGWQNDPATYVISWTEPTTWTPSTVAALGPYYWVRARCDAAVASPSAVPLASRIYLRKARSWLTRLIQAYLVELGNQSPELLGEAQGLATAAARYGFRKNPG